MTTSKKVLDIARSKLGTVESPPNSNHQPFGEWFGFDRKPWCAMFVSWCMDQAGLSKQYRNAAVSFAVDAAKKQGRLTKEFREGYIACRLNSGDWGPGHTGLVEAVHLDGTVTTIEGNTSPGDAGSQRDGGGVWRRRRPKSFWNRQCIRIDYDNTEIHEKEDDDMKTWFVRSPDGSVYVFDGVVLRDANDEAYRSILKMYGTQGNPWQEWSQEQIDAVPKAHNN